ncbi:hypothetical protein CJF31_00004814 [Rutstroemia sp. NJR-2017a BVV2]|nr:hypothetical protein CJF31_00004814 [Rutstroemia sp. NJR-2017a BVV2]
MLALTGTSGNIGGATLKAILEHKLIPASELVICTSSPPSDDKFETYTSQGISVRESDYDRPETMVKAFAGCDKLFLVSTPRNHLDYNNAPYGQGREKHHFAAINAAREAGVKHIFYASLAFGLESKAGVMRAHIRTEKYLKSLTDIKYTIIREGLYQESWPLYLGFYDRENDTRDEVVIAGDGKLSMPAIPDLGVANALILADESGKYDGKLFYLSSSTAYTLQEILDIVSKIRGKEQKTKIVSPEEYVEYYAERRDAAKPMLEWWSSSYTALEEGEALIDDRTFDELLASKGVKPKPMEETIKEMIVGYKKPEVP